MEDLFFFHTLGQPGWLWLAPLALALLVAEWRAKAPSSLRMSTGARLAWMVKERRSVLRFLPALLRCGGLCALLVAMAGPLNGFRQRSEHADVIDIMLCVDVSSSMASSDFMIGTDPANRLDITKIAVANFIESRRLVPEERFGVDRLGLILYAGIAWTACPLTLDYDILAHEVSRVEPASDRDASKSGTAIGSAIGLAVRRLSQSEAKSKVIVLLTDGMNNRFQLDPMTAAQIAAQYKVKIYTLGVGPVDDAQRMGNVTAQARSQGNLVDEETLRKIAAATGGAYFRATDLVSLEQAYNEINQLEPTEIEAGDLYEYEEAHMHWVLLGTLLLGTAVFSRRIWFEVLP
jgi:Ca-activated chloride channel family protein